MELTEAIEVARMDALNELKQNPYRPGTAAYECYEVAHRQAWHEFHKRNNDVSSQS